jgi:opacity protein-like surface antigen
MKNLSLFVGFLTMMGMGLESSAQSRIGVYVGGGLMYYEGDLREKLFPNSAMVSPTVNVGVIWQALPSLSVDLGYHYGKIKGDDQYAVSTTRQHRDLKFESIVHDLSLRVRYYVIRTDLRLFSPYLTAGVGVVNTDPMRDGVPLQPLQTEGVNYGLWNVTVPTGIGFRFNIKCNWAINIEMTYRWTFTDYLDDVSGLYPENEVPFYTDPGGSHPTRDERGDPDWDDGFWDANIGLTYFFYGCNTVSGDNSLGPSRKKNKGTLIESEFKQKRERKKRGRLNSENFK